MPPDDEAVAVGVAQIVDVAQVVDTVHGRFIAGGPVAVASEDELVDQVTRATYPICLIRIGRPVALPPSEGKLSVPDAARTT